METRKEGRKTILVVDDEPEIRKLVSAMVTAKGYNVLTADSGEHARYQHLDFWAYTDVVAPGMSGPMLADKLLEQQPHLSVLFMSGYDNTNVVQRYVVEKGHALLHKPFTVEELGRRVAEILNHPSPASR